jgi:DNA polymerase-3 subunit beta
MKIRCVKNNLEKVLQEAENFVGKNLDLEVLSCVFLEAKNNFLKIEATNIDTSFYAEIPVAQEKEGKVAILGDIFYKTISAINDDEISLELKDDNVIEVESKKSKVQINTLNNEDFPRVMKIENQDEDDLEKKIEISSKDFLNGLNSTFYAASKSNIKPELSSIFIEVDADKINFVATDGYRLAEKSFIYADDSKELFSVLLPGESVSAIIKALSISGDENIEVYFYKSQIFIKSKEFVIFSRLTDGNYVDYKKLIPDDTATSVIILKQDFLDSLKLVNIYSDDFNQIKIIIKDKKIILETKNTVGKNEIEVDGVVVGDEIEMNFNYKYIQDAFSAINTDSFEFVFNPAKPLLITPVGDKTFRYIVMPLSR